MKKALSLLLVLVLALGMSTVAFAAVSPKITGIPEGDGWWTGTDMEYTDLVISQHSDVDDYDGSSITVGPNGIITGSIDVTHFDWNDADSGITATAGTAIDKVVKSSKLTAEIKASKGGQYIDKIELTYDSTTKALTGFEIKMIDPLVNNDPDDGVSFSYRVYLALSKSLSNGKSTYKNPIIVSGKYINGSDTIEADEDYYQFFDNRILIPDAFVKKLEGVLDEDGDCVVWMRALKGAHYWASGSHDDWTEFDDNITEKYPSIDGVYHITHKGLGNVVNNVTFPNYDSTYYVYTPDGETLKYLGRAGANNLPLVGTYYFSVSEIDVDEFEPDDEDGDDDEDWDYDENSEGGGDDLYPSNPHDNPGTGK